MGEIIMGGGNYSGGDIGSGRNPYGGDVCSGETKYFKGDVYGGETVRGGVSLAGHRR